MNNKKEVSQSCRGRFVGLARSLVGVGLGLCAAGCDNRIPLSTFLRQQEDVREEAQAAATTQPAAAVQRSVALINQQLGPYRVGPDDVLGVAITGLDQPTPFPALQVRVNRNGAIELPTVGPVKVADLELQDVETTIRKAYVPAVFREISVSVETVSTNMTNVLVVGAVTKPGLIPLRRTERNLLFAIVSAGGVTDVAAGQVILRRIRRPNEEVTLDLTTVEGLKASLALAPLESGDIVNVKSKPSSIFVGGLVNAPHAMVVPSGTDVTLLQAIAAAGGLRTDVTPREATLIRRVSEDHDVHVKINMDRVTSGQDPNIRLAIGDIVWVPDTIETRVQDWINKNIYFKAGASMNVSYNVTGMEFLNYRELQKSQMGGGTSNIQNQIDPFGFMQRSSALQNLVNRPAQ